MEEACLLDWYKNCTNCGRCKHKRNKDNKQINSEGDTVYDDKPQYNE